jgi:pyruvate dehydrogenase E1 component beta subunit
LSAELAALVAERAFSRLRAAPQRIALPDHPTPTSPALADSYYPRAKEIVEAAARILGLPCAAVESAAPGVPLDVPDPAFAGPF